MLFGLKLLFGKRIVREQTLDIAKHDVYLYV